MIQNKLFSVSEAFASCAAKKQAGKQHKTHFMYQFAFATSVSLEMSFSLLLKSETPVTSFFSSHFSSSLLSEQFSPSAIALFSPSEKLYRIQFNRFLY